MKILLSPAKSFKIFDPKSMPQSLREKFNTPHFVAEAKYLIELLKDKNKEQLKQLMKISNKVAELNIGRYQQWQSIEKIFPALFFFNGGVYKSLNTNGLSEAEILFLQDHLLILSGLYGILKPMDLIFPYRLEMGISLANNQGKNLYFFWQKKLQNYFKKYQDEIIINLASNEYYKALNFKNNLSVCSIDFKDYYKGSFKTIGILAKKQGEKC